MKSKFVILAYDYILHITIIWPNADRKKSQQNKIIVLEGVGHNPVLLQEIFEYAQVNHSLLAIS